MKRLVMLALCLLVLVSGAFALDKAVGGGTLFHNIEDNWGPGVFVFFGIGQFVELNAGVSFYTFGDESFTSFQGGIYGKYPIPLSDMFVFFPTAGLDIEYASIGGNSDILLWGRGGLGLDIFFSERLFLRTHVIAGYAYDLTYDASGFGMLIKVGLGWML
ncbi:MAG: hypothetical protein LBH20_04780 [Treponema sp.]|jgi:hypothetical protein|nr:hypothetical protein [Treponema sp.]